jgi:hypothetical protein
MRESAGHIKRESQIVIAVRYYLDRFITISQPAVAWSSMAARLRCSDLGLHNGARSRSIKVPADFVGTQMGLSRFNFLCPMSIS